MNAPAPEQPQTRNSNLPPILFLVFLSLVFFSNVLIRIGVMAPGGDIRPHHYYWKSFISWSFRQGAIPFWVPNIFAGMPFMPSQQGGVFYPTGIFYGFLPVTAAINMDFILHFFLAGWFMYLLIRDLRLSRAAGFLGAIIWAFNGLAFSMFASGHLPHVNSYVWLPLIFMFSRRLLKNGDLQNAGFLALVFGVQFLASHPQYWIYTGMLAGFYALWWVVDSNREAPDIRSTVKGAAWLGLGLGLGIGLVLMQLLPAMESMKYSATSVPPMGPEYYFQGSLHPMNLPAIIAPNLLGNIHAGVYFGKGFFWENCIFLGVWTSILCLVALMRRKRMPEGWFFPATALIALLFAMGNYTPIYPLALKIIPVFKLVRQPTRMTFLFIFSATIMAAYGFNTLLETKTPWSPKAAARFLKFAIIAGISLAALSLAVFLFRQSILNMLENPITRLVNASGQVDAGTSAMEMKAKIASYIGINLLDTIRSGLALVLGCFFVLKFTQGKIKKATLALVLPLIVFMEFFLFARPMIHPAPFNGREIGDKIKQIIADTDPLGAREPFRVLVLHPGFSRNEGMITGIFSLNGYDSLVLKNYGSYIYNFYKSFGVEHQVNPNSGVRIEPMPRLGDLLSKLNAKYVAADSSIKLDDPVLYGNNFSLIGAGGGVYVYKNLLPCAYVTFRPDPGGPPQNFSYEVMETNLDFISMKIQSPGPGLAVINEIYYPEWKAFVDDKPAGMTEVDGLFRGVRVGAGAHTLTMRFISKSFKSGLTGSVVTLIIILVMILIPASITRKRRTQS